jgi:hypothetical protein
VGDRELCGNAQVTTPTAYMDSIGGRRRSAGGIP